MITGTSQQAPTLSEQTNRTLLKIIRSNFNTKYATQVPTLSGFREAVSAHGGTDIDATLLADFRTHVPLSNYSSYKPFVDKFNAQPCKKEDVENLLAPGLPGFLASTGGTTGLTPKILPKYDHLAGTPLLRRPFLDPTNEKPLAAVVCCGNEGVKEIVDVSGQVMQKILVCLGSGGMLRRCLGWKYDDDEARMSLRIPNYAVPFAATVIDHLPSFLTIHGVFFLARRDLDRFYVPFSTLFADLIRTMDEQWYILVSSIRSGTLPDLEGIDHVRECLQAQFHADPERAAELLKIGPPFSLEGWAARVWPNAAVFSTISSGPFRTQFPKLKYVMGPDIQHHSFGYGATECAIGVPFGTDKQEEFMLWSDDVIELLDIFLDETHENIRQPWEVEVGKYYEPILTTRDGLWRYQLGDILLIVGFNPDNNSPIFKFAGRKLSTIHFPHTQIIENQSLEAITAISSEDILQVQEFTTVVDDRSSPPTVGFFVEPAGPLGPNAHLAPAKVFDALVAANIEHQCALEHGQIRLPTIRILKAGAFGAYRCWRAKLRNIASGQIKVPMVLVDPVVKEWFLERVTQEL